MIFRRRHLTYKIALFAVALLLFGYAGYHWHRQADESSPPPSQIRPRDSQSKLTVKGMTYKNFYKGKPLIVMKVGSLEFGEKKMGFFRVGGVRQLLLRGAEIDYYEFLVEGDKKVDHVEDSMDLSSEMLTAAQSLTKWKGRLAEVQARRVRLRYHHADGEQTDIDGDLLEFERSDKSLRIKGNAYVRYAARSLSSDEIFFQPEEKTFFTKKNYTLIVNGESQRGNAIRTDLFLNPLPEKTIMENRVATSNNSNRVDSRAKHFENDQDSKR